MSHWAVRNVTATNSSDGRNFPEFVDLVNANEQLRDFTSAIAYLILLHRQGCFSRVSISPCNTRTISH